MFTIKASQREEPCTWIFVWSVFYLESPVKSHVCCFLFLAYLRDCPNRYDNLETIESKHFAGYAGSQREVRAAAAAEDKFQELLGGVGKRH